MSERVLHRAMRRETHAPRTLEMTIVVLLVVACLLWIATETVLQLSSRPPLLVSPTDMLAWAGELPDVAPPWAVGTAAGTAAIVGAVLFGLAVSPGRRARHALEGAGSAVLVDNGVIAAAVAGRVAEEAGLRAEAVVVGVGHRVVDISVRPDLGLPVDAEGVRRAADTEITDYRTVPALRARVRIAREREA